MKTLTIISTIFIPLSFLTGVFGMNFQHMPGLGLRHGFCNSIGGHAHRERWQARVVSSPGPVSMTNCRPSSLGNWSDWRRVNADLRSIRRHYTNGQHRQKRSFAACRRRMTRWRLMSSAFQDGALERGCETRVARDNLWATPWATWAFCLSRPYRPSSRARPRQQRAGSRLAGATFHNRAELVAA